jgi:hypothetical protein
MNKIIKALEKSPVFSIIAIAISLFSLYYTYSNYADRKANTGLYININRLRNLMEYEKRIDLIFENNSTNIIDILYKTKGSNFIYDNYDLIEYMYLTKVTYDLVNDSYEPFFIRNNFKDIYNDVGRSINIEEVSIFSRIFWNNNNLNDINVIIIDEIIGKLRYFDKSIKREKLNVLLKSIKCEKEDILIKIECDYKKYFKKNNIEKELIEEYFKLNDNYNGFTLAQKDWFNLWKYEEQNDIDSYFEMYFSSKLSRYFLEELKNNYLEK